VQRRTVPERPDWRAQAEQVGFVFHTIDGEPYWDERACYAFTLDEIEQQIEDPSQELAELCYQAVGEVLKDSELMQRMRIPAPAWDYIATTWQRGDKDLYGRFDFRYDGTGPSKMLEFNADTPTALFEAAYFQWAWLEGAREQGIVPAEADQFNSIQETLIDALGRFGFGRRRLTLACVKNHPEDRGTVEYLEDCARQAGVKTGFVYMEDIGIDGAGRFTDLEDTIITDLFKLYPWEWLLEEEFAQYMLKDVATIIEPAWKMVLSNKGLLAVLWKMFPDHPHLLPAFFEDDAGAQSLIASGQYARKPIFGREGANVELVGGNANASAAGPYGAEGYIVQGLAPLPNFEGNYPVLGSWIVAGQACGLGIREDTSPITTNASRFLPHIIDG
jgi:glutathionylspermidine synthase